VTYLLIVSIIWSASFGLFKACLTTVDPSLVAFLRLGLALLVFAPLLNVKALPTKAKVAYFGIGAVQYGMMYLFFNHSFRYLNGWQVALMTVFTPFYIVIIEGLWKKKFDVSFLAAALLAVAGATIAIYEKGIALPSSIAGCVLVQLSDISFALGVLAYRNVRKKHPEVPDARLYALLFAGGTTIALGMTILSGGFAQIGTLGATQWEAVLYMGLVSSGLCFFLWNVGATQVSTGTLAVMSDMKIPMAVAVSLLFFKESTGSWLHLATGGTIIVFAVYLAHRRTRTSR
jgi:drug/metabolite transporter (DMT)-like permease